MNNFFNPFGKKIEFLERADLNTLIDNNVSEGWFVEFKAQMPESIKVAKSIASFANTEGGWLIVGIVDDINNAASEISGFDLLKLKQPKEHIKNIVSAHIAPIPYFESKLIELESQKGVIVIWVPKSEEAPHILSDGKIYRRIGESSEPIPEKNRHAVEELYNRNKNTKAHLENFSKNKFIMSKQQKEKDLAFIELYFFTLPIATKFFSNFYSMEFADSLRRHFLKPVNFIENLPLSSNIDITFFQASSGSYILRPEQAKYNPQLITVIIEIFEDHSCKIILPIEELAPKAAANNLHLTEILKKIDPIPTRIMDGYTFTIRFLTIVEQYIALVASQSKDIKLGFRIKLTNIWNKVLYIDDEGYLEYVKKHGLPLSLKDEIEMPEFKGTLRFEFNDRPNAITLLRYIYEALGVPGYEMPEFFNNFGNFINSLQKPKV
jgi:hypothetical protein